MRLKSDMGAANALVALLIVFFFLACHGAPDAVHQTAHLDAAGTHHTVPAQAAGDEDEAPATQAQEADQNGSGMSANYAAALLALALGAAMLLSAAPSACATLPR